MSTKFLFSVGKEAQFPPIWEGSPLMPEVAVVGRSNVGKSSLINHFANRKGLAKVSSTPGKTQLVNFFLFEGIFHLVDLPGYGYAKVSKEKRSSWGDLAQSYFEKSPALKLILLLCDLRHGPTHDDLAFAEWADHYNHPLLVVFTKADKLKKNEVEKNLKEYSVLFPHAKTMPYTIKEGRPRQELMRTLKEYL